MSVSSYIVNFQTETLAVKFQARVCLDYAKEIHQTETVIESENLETAKSEADYLNKMMIGFFIFA